MTVAARTTTEERGGDVTYSAVMADLLALSSHIIDNNDTEIHPNRVINELSELLAILD